MAARAGIRSTKTAVIRTGTKLTSMNIESIPKFTGPAAKP